jgi:predicted permease
VGDVRPTLVAIAAGSLLLLLVACANAAHLLLGHIATRSREFTVRRAVGASRSQLVQQVLCEGIVLSATALLAAIAASRWSTDVIRSLAPSGVYGLDNIVVDGRTLIAAAGIGIVTTLVFALGPALSAWPAHALDMLRTASVATDTTRSSRLRQLLVIGEVATACVLLCGALVLLRVLLNLNAVDTGISRENALTFRLMLPEGTYPDSDAVRTIVNRLEDQLHRTPSVQTVGFTSQLPGAADRLIGGVPLLHEELPQPANPADRLVPLLTVTPDYFAAAGIRVLAGRAFTAQDNFYAYPVVVVSERVADLLGVRPSELVGDRLIVPGGQRGNTWSVVVGVVADVMMHGPDGPASGLMYRPLAQRAGRFDSPWVVVGGPADSQPSVTAVRAAIARADPALPMFNVRTFKQVRADALGQRRFAMTMLSAFGVASFGLAAIGLYAVIAYAVQRRTREFGIRLALGASPATLRRRILGGAVLIGGAGALVGAILSVVATRLLWALIPGFGSIDLGTVAVVSLAVLAMAVLAALVPAHRATRMDPLVALRND